MDFSPAAADYAAHRPPFDPRLFDRLAHLGIGRPNQTILDVGAGTGLLGQGLARRGATLTECDPSPRLLQQSPSQRPVLARAEFLPFADTTFDAVTAGQCWHWFDRELAPREIYRILKPAGRIAIVYQTYLPIQGNVAAASEQLILQFRPNWRHAGAVGINGQALKDLQSHGFKEIESFTFDTEISYTRQTWQGVIRTCSAVAPTLSAIELQRFEVAHENMLQSWPRDFDVPHRVFAAVATRP